MPVHSYRTDPATSLHLLCMPYFGPVTLARLLADPKARVAPTGAELLEALDRLDPPPKTEDRSARSSSRSTLARLPFARAIAWWGSKLADALGHAHDRGVLHRDIKPSNVLVTSDGLPMLLDFNLAGDPRAEAEGLEPDRLGGTLAYMAPEHLDAMALGEDDRLDARADVFSLGVLLYEALTGSRPFPVPTGDSIPEALARAAESRRRPPPRLRAEHPEIPAPLERVIRRCLEPDPADRYPVAAELAADLQAVADDGPLRWTREPLHVRAVRRARRSWKPAVLVAVVVGSAVALAMAGLREEGDRARAASMATALLEEGKQSSHRDDFATAVARFQEVERLTRGRDDLRELGLRATVGLGQARQTAEMGNRANAVTQAAASLRLRLIEPSSRQSDADSALKSVLEPFHVLDDPGWIEAPALRMLDKPREIRLLRDAEELLFLYAAGVDPNDDRATRRTIALCDRGSRFAADPRPWLALRDWIEDSPISGATEDPGVEPSARACFEWGVLESRKGRPAVAIGWLEQSAAREPENAWYHYHLASVRFGSGDAQGSLAGYQAAIAADPANRRYRLDLARAYRSLGEWVRADRVERLAQALP